MPTDRISLPWAPLARAAVTNLREAHRTGVGYEDANAMADVMATCDVFTRAAAETDPPSHLPPGEADAILVEGDDPRRFDGAGRDWPEIHVPTSDLIAALRLAATLGAPAGRDATLASGAVTLIRTADQAETDALFRVVHALLPGKWRCSSQPRVGNKFLRLHSIPGSDEGRLTVRRAIRELREALSECAPILCAAHEPEALPSDLRDALRPRSLAPIDADILLTVLRASHSATGALDEGAVRAALPPDAELATLDATALLLALRAPTPIEVARRVGKARCRTTASGPTLADISGYGTAEQQARRMVRDLRGWISGTVDWSEVERSVIFHGSPGTGKSFLARAMAGEAGIRHYTGSFAAWQAAGHLGDMLRAMRESFAEAHRSAPCVFVIDEIDAVGSRDGADRHGQRYHRQVVNGFLQALDALAEMEGVLVVGTCNALHEIDPAVLRPGRFDRHVSVPLPGRAAIARMVRAAVPDAPESDLAPAIRVATGLTAAATDAAIRGARAAAREEDAPLAPRHLLDELADRIWPPEIARRIALHEAGHAIVAHALNLGRITRIALTPDGGEIAMTSNPTHGLLSEHEAHLAYHLAGRAAERLCLGAPSSGAGGPSASDLAKATRLAYDIEHRYGLGQGSLVWKSTAETHDAAIGKRLEVAEKRALEILRDRGPALQTVTVRLQEAGVLEGKDIRALLGKADGVIGKPAAAL